MGDEQNKSHSGRLELKALCPCDNGYSPLNSYISSLQKEHKNVCTPVSSQNDLTCVVLHCLMEIPCQHKTLKNNAKIIMGQSLYIDTGNVYLSLLQKELLLLQV